MLPRTVFKNFILLLFFGASIASAEQLATPSDTEPPTSLKTNNPNYAHSPMTPNEIMCLLRAVKVPEKHAHAAAEAFARALNSMKLNSSTFNRISLMHLLAQSYKESQQFSSLTQKGRVSESKRGYGYIQVTGKHNRKQAVECMANADPGSEKDVYEFPGITIGRMAYQAALASVCWWKKNVIENPHFTLSLNADTKSAQKLTHIVNAGAINKRITGGEANARERANIFKKLMLAEPQCRQNP